MDMMLEERSPRTCLDLGLDCRSCVGRAAENVAYVCHGMSSQALGSMFVQLYPSPACAPMSLTFEAAYKEASAPRKPLVRTVAAA